MRARLASGKRPVWQVLVAAGCIGAFLFALVLSAIPQLHERVHGAAPATNHECAVTLLASGSYQHAVTGTISPAPPPPPAHFSHTPASFRLVTAHLEFSLLEHAPPSVS